jgi:hypothetical protein
VHELTNLEISVSRDIWHHLALERSSDDPRQHLKFAAFVLVGVKGDELVGPQRPCGAQRRIPASGVEQVNAPIVIAVKMRYDQLYDLVLGNVD